ncbi:MAG: 2-C-methyl-D-erythritol 4-phosphate cytidylyltransferase [Candidatus Improbicoccus devescovinae]|nr:MAG: 2-C-methyl-D-erythritol 4-phosphate cytidylyltransferase [Candidatus Improbicoccus devescovinae]
MKKINLTTSQIRQLQLKSLEIFIFFSNFCDKNNLKFFVCGGCCIGAIRNHGFIPWDDDMDIFMLREDYEKFKKIFTKNNKNKKYFCLLPLNNYEKNINHSFVKIIDTTTTIVKQNNSGCEETTGVELDIFPLDGCPSSHIKRKIQILYALFYCLYSSEVIPEKYGKLVKILCIIFLKLVPGRKNKQKLCLFFEKNMSKYKIKECNYITELCAGPKYMMNKYPKKIFESNILKKFENILVPLPVGYDQYLKIVFGNYMELPQKKDQTPHHNIIFINFN